MTNEELIAALEKFVEVGDQKAYETFVLEHFKEFPEEVQGKLLMGFFTETFDKNKSGTDDVQSIQREGIDALEKLQAIKDAASKQE